MSTFQPRHKASPERVKTEFVTAIQRSTAERIREKQQQVVTDWNLFEEGKLINMLKGHFSVNQSGGGVKLVMRYLIYARYLDMKDPRRKVKRDGYWLYNKIVFGILYNKTLPALRYGFTEDIQKQIGQALINTAFVNDKRAIYINNGLMK